MKPNRRTFFGRIFGGLLSAFAVPLFGRAPAPVVPEAMADRQTGIAIRFIKQWDIQADQSPVRLDWVFLAPDEEINGEK